MTSLDAADARPSICVGCGLCCDGTLFRSARLTDDDDHAPLIAAGLRIMPKSNDRQAFEQPCPAFKDGCCSIYEIRPYVCGAYTCTLYNQHHAGKVSYEEAASLIALTIDVRDRLKPGLERLLNDDERAVLNELYRVLLAKFDSASIYARSMGDRLPTEIDDDLADVLPMTDLRLRRPDLDVDGTKSDVQRRRSEGIGDYDVLVATAPLAERLTAITAITAASHTLTDYSAAAQFAAEMVSVSSKLLGPDDPATLLAREGAAWWTGMGGRPLETLSMLRSLVADRTRVLGVDHPDTLASRHELADWTGVCGQPNEALAALRLVLADRERVLGPDHPNTLNTRHSIAYWTGTGGDGREALRRYDDLLADRLRLVGPTHPDTLATRAAIAYWTGRDGDSEEAAALTAAVLLDRIKLLGADHVQSRMSARAVAYWTRQLAH